LTHNYLATLELDDRFVNEIHDLESFIKAIRNSKNVNKKKAAKYLSSTQKIKEGIESRQQDELSEFWIQTLMGLEVSISDMSLGTNDRDKQMADNLIWLREKYPSKKIICWGATSHFLYNSSLIEFEDKKIQLLFGGHYAKTTMMGEYIKQKYKDDVYTIGFIAHEGNFGVGRGINIDSPPTNSLEYLIGKESKDNYFLPLNELSLENYLSRPLAHQYMTTDITQVMDGVVFNRNMRKPIRDWEFLFYLVPENNMRPKKKEKFLEADRIRREEEKIKLKEY